MEDFIEATSVPQEEPQLLARFAEPQCYIIEPRIDGRNAMAKAGARAKSLFGREAESIVPIRRRLLPFWKVHCMYRTEYPHAALYVLAPNDPNARVIYVTGRDVADQERTLRVSIDIVKNTKTAMLTGTEFCIAESEKTNVISAYDALNSVSGLDKTRRMVGSLFPIVRPDETTRLANFTSKNRVLVPESLRQAFLRDGQVHDLVLFRSISEDPLQIIMPNRPIRQVVYETIQQTHVKIESSGISKAEINVDSIDLYFHPIYVFGFISPGAKTPILQQLDAVDGTWFELNADEEKRLSDSNAQWDKVLLFTLDVANEIVRTFAPPGFRVVAIIAQKGLEYFG